MWAANVAHQPRSRISDRASPAEAGIAFPHSLQPQGPPIVLTRIFPLVALLACLPLVASAQQATPKPAVSFPPGVVMHDTVLAAHLDLTQVDVKANTQTVSKLLGHDTDSPLGSVAEAVLNMLRGAGANDVYLTVPGRALLLGGVCVVIPCDDKAAVSNALTGLLNMAPQTFEFRVLQTDTAVVVCPAMMASEFEAKPTDTSSVDRPEFDAGLEAMAGFPHKIIASLPADIREELATLWPEKLGDYDPTGISPQRLAESARSLAIGWSLPPKVNLEIRIQGTDQQGAAACEQELSKLLKLIPPGMPRPTISVEAETVLIKTDPEKLQTFFAPIMQPAQQNVRRQQTTNNFKQLALAMHNFYAKHGFLPGKYTVDADGRPLLSWRVALLPHLEQAPLYAKFKLDEPWDSEHNRPLADQMPEVFSVVGDDLPAGKCRVRLPVIAGGLWSGSGVPRTFRDITDGTSNTIWMSTAPKSAAVAWTKPDDWNLDEAKLNEQFFGDQAVATASYADGSVHAITPAITAETLKALLTIAGREVVQQEDIK